MLWFGPFRFDPSDRVLYRDEVEVPLPPRALGVLEHLLQRPGKLVSKRELIDAVWKDAVVTETSLIEAVSVVRQALGDDRQQPTYIQTIHRRGYRFIAILRVEIEPAAPAAAPATMQSDFAPAPPETPVSDGQQRSRRLILTAAALLIATLAGWMLIEFERDAPSRPVMRAVIDLSEDQPLFPGTQPDVALSQDGTRLVYAAGSVDDRQLYVREMGRVESQPIAGSLGGFAPFFSPDGRWVGFFAEGKLKKVSLESGGGAPMLLCDAPDPYGGTWSTDETIIFAPSASSGLVRVAASGGEPTPVTRVDSNAGEIGHRWPEALPGGQAVIATIWRSASDDPRVAAFSLTDRRQVALAEQGTFGRYVPTGHLVFGRGSSLVAVPFNAQDLRTAGPPVSILGGLTVDPTTGAGQFTFSATGTLLYVPREMSDSSRVNMVVEWFEELRRLVPPIALSYQLSALSESRFLADG
jgi:serine/threonine-protein kinase